MSLGVTSVTPLVALVLIDGTTGAGWARAGLALATGAGLCVGYGRAAPLS